VEDHGVGIPPEHAERVFERFYRVDPARAAESGGAGLGLAIVRRIARLHGGDVVLEPVSPHGCRFVFTLR
ncbi:MAG: sensor histidine kinase, partial [Kiritimatiellae bacterium]|nr:sensor histidine kinase [Kiritimatiellia bacterium]